MIEVRLPWPPQALSPNARLHWAVIAKVKKSYREVCRLETLAQLGRQRLVDGPVQVHIEFYRPTRRSMDWDNLIARMKAGLDGLSDALKINDRQFRLSMKVADQTGGFVLVKISKEQ